MDRQKERDEKRERERERGGEREKKRKYASLQPYQCCKACGVCPGTVLSGTICGKYQDLKY